MRADRLISILMLLQSHGRMTAHELANKLEVSERTIYRDLEGLSNAGIPIYTERGPGGGCALMDGYQTRLTGLTEAEVQTLFMSNRAALFTDLGLSATFEAAMRKLHAALPASSRESAEWIQQRFHLDASWWYHKDNVYSYLNIIQAALLQDYKLYLHYQEDDGAISEKTIEPYGLVAKADVWYLIGSYACNMKVLRVERIQHAEMIIETFTRPQDFDLAHYWADYCKEAEMQHPTYAVPLRLAPDEVSQLSRTLSAWGYTLVENTQNVKSLDQKQHIISFRSYQHNKNRHSPSLKKGISLEHNVNARPAQQKKRLPTSYKKKHFKKQNCSLSPKQTSLKKMYLIHTASFTSSVCYA